MSSEIEFDLSSPITYESKGDQTEGFKLILKAPTNKQRQHRNALVDYIRKANNATQDRMAKMMDLINVKANDFVEIASSDEIKKEVEKKDAEEIGKEIMGEVFDCEGIKTNAFVEEFLLLMSGVCMVEGEKEMTKPIFDKMSCDDTDRLMAVYIGNFMNGSY